VYGGDGSTKFCIPDYQGMFLRGQDQQQGRDPDSAARYRQGNPNDVIGDTVGSWQDDVFVPHSHGLQGTWGCDNNYSDVWCKSASQDGGDAGPTDAFGGGDTRPMNVAVNFAIYVGNVNGGQRGKAITSA
jgi:hypothetical protein